jgi:hypothetical protein
MLTTTPLLVAKQVKPINIKMLGESEQTPFTENVYTSVISWTNTDTRQSIIGSVQFTVSSKKSLDPSTVTFLFQDKLIVPQKYGNALVFTLPSQSFLAGATGTFSFKIIYHNPLTYNWQIVVNQG